MGNALPADAFAASPRGAAEAFRRPCALAWLRMNHGYKNYLAFCGLPQRSMQQNPNAEFSVLGDGPLRAELEREAARLGLGASATFLGDRQDIAAILASLDVAVNTSGSESLSNVILEAMAAGLPVVAYDVGGNSELLTEQRGTLVSSGDEAGFADAVLRLLADSSVRERLGREARQFARENFSLNRVRQRYAELYATLLAKKRRGKLRA